MRLLLAAVILGAGCYRYRPPTPPKTVPVHGRIILPGGAPLTAGTVVFKPKARGKIQSAVGQVERDGSFTLTSFNKGDGAQPGEYVVVVEPLSYKTGVAVTVRGVPVKYQKESTSDLVVTVDREGPGALLLRMR